MEWNLWGIWGGKWAGGGESERDKDGKEMERGKERKGMERWKVLALVVALVERWTRDRKVAGSTPGRGAIKSTRSTQPFTPPG